MAIPAERFLGVCFKDDDQDLITWKAKSKKKKMNLVKFARSAIREKIAHDKEHQRLEHPAVMLRRLEAQQGELYVMVQKVLSLLAGGHLTGIRVGKDDVIHAALSVSAPNNLDRHCVEAGWE